MTKTLTARGGALSALALVLAFAAPLAPAEAQSSGEPQAERMEMRAERAQPGFDLAQFVARNFTAPAETGSDYVGKPFSNEQLITKVKKALHRAGKLELLFAGEKP